MYNLITVLILAAFLQGCAAGGAHSISGQRLSQDQVIESFQSGNLRLTCDTACSGSWGGKRAIAKSRYNNELWYDLVYLVTTVGFRADQTYYYLGRAAEGLNFPDAASTYYRLALSNQYKCDGFFDNCDDIEIDLESKRGLERISLTKKSQEQPVKSDKVVATSKDSSESNSLSEKSLPEKEVQPTRSVTSEEPKAKSEQAPQKISNAQVAQESPDSQRQPSASGTSKTVPVAKVDNSDNVASNKKDRSIREPKGAELEQMKEALKEELRDPYSAKFGEARVLGDMACLGVNAKNGFGGYTGMKYQLMLWHSELKKWFPMSFIRPGELYECVLVLLKDTE